MQPPIHIPSFGRRRGRRLTAGRNALYANALPKLSIPSSTESLLPERLFGRAAPLWFEIGFGGGEHLVEQARRRPQIDFIGCEPYINGMAKLFAAIGKHGLSNIRIYGGDARDILQRLSEGSVERLFVLFPDPWPKARHHKRRIVSQPSLELFYRALKPGGLLRLATDHDEYAAWMLEQILLHKKFLWTAQNGMDWKNPPAEWVTTRYQQKAHAQGRRAIFLDLRR